ncbi:FtsJ-like methyltransferase-domain-containing protein [Calycina marina]|uniref:rRNA methyltransferase 2, mitochondrial n=1 Tax=Calycina marina TaxID=1763456 RepID=A0A9P7YX41_9HELO|nr:FtsJ-like methyltransferase-domain-containing protein [Calycina marina]
MDLCSAALIFAYDALKVGGHFVCKFYQGSEDKDFENSLRKMFATVHREKPESSRSESKEAYFVALRRKPDRKKDVDGKEGHGTEETEFLDDDYDLKEVGEKVENSEEADEAK